jgi:hypothetical protein
MMSNMDITITEMGLSIDAVILLAAFVLLSLIIQVTIK